MNSIAKNNRKYAVTIASTVCISAILAASDCYAYLDPSAGGWLYQMIFPVIVALSGVWLFLQRHILDLWRRLFSDNIVGRLTESARNFISNEKVKTIIMLPAVFAGAILPVEFLSEANGYLGYMRAWELFPVFGWQWLFFTFAGSICSFFTILCCKVVSKRIRISADTIAYKALLWLSVSLFLFSLLKGTKLWIEATGVASILMPEYNWFIAVLTAISCAIWIKQSSHTAYYLIRFAKFIASAGLVLTVIAPIVTWVEKPEEGVLPVVSPAVNATKRPNIIIVTVDSLNTSHMSLYGYERLTTPNVDRFAKQADVYERFYANSNMTNSSVNSMLHGVRPWDHRALQLPAMPLISFAKEGMVGKLKVAGYQTFAVATNRYAAPYINLTDKYFDRVVYGQINRLSARIGMILTKFHHIHPLFRTLVIDASLDEKIDRLLVSAGVYEASNHFDPERALSSMREMIQNRKPDSPFFTWVHLYPPHSPYATPAPFIGRFDQSSRHRTRDDSTPPWCYVASADKTFPDEYVGRYDESVAYVDSHIGKFVDWLKAQGVYDDSLIVISSDHGESFSHGYGAHSGPAMHEDLIHVPLIIKEPNQIKGQRLSVLSEQIDIMPTIMEYAGFPATTGSEGISLKPGTHLDKIYKPIFSMNFQQNYCFGQLITGTVAMIQGDWKFVIYFGDIQYPAMPTLENALYNLRSDPDENFNLISAQPAIANEMMSAIGAKLRKHGGAVE